MYLLTLDETIPKTYYVEEGDVNALFAYVVKSRIQSGVYKTDAALADQFVSFGAAKDWMIQRMDEPNESFTLIQLPIWKP